MANEETPTYDSLEACVYSELGQWTVPGAAVGIYQDGKVETYAFGVANVETGQAVRPDTLFQIGSTTKVYTATLVMQLVDEGKLGLDAPVVEYVSELKLADEAARNAITLRQLLSHTSGIEGDRFDDYGLGDDALAKAVAEFHTLGQLSAPGELWSYCNTGFSLAGRIIEKVTKQSWEAVLRERLLKPIGAERSFAFAHEAIAYPVAVGHQQERSKKAIGPVKVARNYALPRAVAPAGAIIASVGDLMKFAALHLDGGTVGVERVLSRRSVETMQTEQTKAANFADAYGLGWALHTMGGERVVGHGGTTYGFQAWLSLLPDKGFAIAVLTNGDRGHRAIKSIQDWALNHYRGVKRTDPPTTKLPATALEAFTGTYENRYAEVVVAAEDGKLRIDTTGKNPETNERETSPPTYVTPIGEREFIVPEGDSEGMRVDFIPGADAKARYIRIGGRLVGRPA